MQAGLEIPWAVGMRMVQLLRLRAAALAVLLWCGCRSCKDSCEDLML